MFSALSLLLVTTALSVVMLLVLSSLSGSGVQGIREWSVGNGLAVTALLLFAGRGVVPDVVSIELANALFMMASALMFVGFRRHFSRSVPTRILAAAIGLVLVVVGAFHYGVDWIGPRIVAVSVFHGCICLAMAITVHRATPPAHARYPYLFTTTAAAMLAVGHAARALVYLFEAATPAGLLDSAILNLVFLSIGTLALPALTLGAVMMANAEIISKTTYAADHDYLTGAWSRRAFFRLAGAEHDRLALGKSALSLLLLDVDHFKKINDTYGHAVGDQVLVDIVRCTEGIIRSMDFCARLGGEEFAVLLPGADAQTALMVAERLRNALECSVHVVAQKVSVTYTVSIGIASLEPDESVASLLSRADTALYSAKSAGRNTAMTAQFGGGMLKECG
jgi:diguanylate cyclase (GGDEF)-like protein